MNKKLSKQLLVTAVSAAVFAMGSLPAQSSQLQPQLSTESQGNQQEILASPANVNTYTVAEVALNNTRSSCWTIISGSVYNITSYIASHPGGVAAISQLCGKDGTLIFSRQHQGDPTPATRLASLKIGSLVADATSCSAGSYLSVQIKKCIPAPVGFFVSAESAAAGQTFADPCLIGSFTNVAGSSSCKLAPIGSYVSAQGQSSALTCPVGTTTENLGSDSIEDCITAELQAPVATSPNVTEVTANSVKLAWDKLDAARYGVVLYTAKLTPSGLQCSTTEGFCLITGLTVGTSYLAELSATNSLGTAKSETGVSFTAWFSGSPPNSKCAASTLDEASLKPQITGLPKPGLTLTASLGVWPTGTKTCLLWLRNQEVISGQTKTTYKVQNSDIGKELRFVVVETDKAGKSLARISDFRLGLKLTFDKASKPSIVGVPKVGTKVSAKFSSWLSGSSYTYQWNVGGVAKPGASNSSYIPDAEDVGKNLTLTLCGRKDLYEEKCLTSSEITIAPGTLAVPSTLSLLGTAKVGSTMSVKPVPLPSSSMVSYVWRRDGVAIPNSDSSSYLVTALDRGKKISVQLTVITKGYLDIVRLSAEKKIP